jgi:hypothetical protein
VQSLLDQLQRDNQRQQDELHIYVFSVEDQAESIYATAGFWGREDGGRAEGQWSGEDAMAGV